ncbi:hypoxanthine phosphoribosyltransferase [Chloroflexota bacterium]
MPSSTQDKLTVLLSRQEITTAVQRLASEVRRDYQGKPPLLVGVLKGAFVFMADLVRALDMPLTLDFVRVSTYGQRTRSSGRPRIVQGVRSPIKGRHILVVEDIVDTGVTTRFLLDYMRQKDAASVKLCALLSKPARRHVEVHLDYLGFTIPDKFVVGYGLDLAQQYRHLPDICVLEAK